MTMQSATIQISAAGPTQIVKGVPGKIIGVCSWSLAAPGTFEEIQGVQWRCSGGKLLTGLRYLTQYNLAWDMPMATVRPPGRTDYYFTTPLGEDLQLFQTIAFDLGGFVTFEMVPQ